MQLWKMKSQYQNVGIMKETILFMKIKNGLKEFQNAVVKTFLDPRGC